MFQTVSCLNPCSIFCVAKSEYCAVCEATSFLWIEDKSCVSVKDKVSLRGEGWKDGEFCLKAGGFQRFQRLLRCSKPNPTAMEP